MRRSYMYRRYSISISNIDVGAALDKQLCHIQITCNVNRDQEFAYV